MLSLILPLLLAQDITVPPQVTVPENNFIIITPETKCSQVEWVMLTPGLTQLAQNELADQKKFVAVGAKGTYKVLCYTALDNKPSKPAYVTIIVGGAEPDGTQLSRDLRAAYTEKNPEAVKSFQDGFKSVLDDIETVKTIQELNNLISNYLKDNAEGQLVAVKSVIKSHLKLNFGSNGSVVIDQKFAKKVLSDIVSALGGLQ